MVDLKCLNRQIIFLKDHTLDDLSHVDYICIRALHGLGTGLSNSRIHCHHRVSPVGHVLQSCGTPCGQLLTPAPPQGEHQFGIVHRMVAVQMREEYAANLARIKRGDVVFVACSDSILHRPGTDIEQVRLTFVNDGDTGSRTIGIRDRIAGPEHDHLRFLVELCLRWFVTNFDYSTGYDFRKRLVRHLLTGGEQHGYDNNNFPDARHPDFSLSPC